MANGNFIVVKTQILRPMPLAQALFVAKKLREQGYGTEIIPEAQAPSIAEPQQDLTPYIERARRAQQENEQKNDTQLEIPNEEKGN